MLFKILRFFGLITIKDARHIVAEMAKADMRLFKEWCRQDAPELYQLWRDNAEQQHERFACESFDQIIEEHKGEPFDLRLKFEQE